MYRLHSYEKKLLTKNYIQSNTDLLLFAVLAFGVCGKHVQIVNYNLFLLTIYSMFFISENDI